MFKRPEELIVAILAILWVVLTYFSANYFGAPTQTSLLITALTLIWAAVCFVLWQRNLSRYIWPCFLGLLVACWWPFLDWFAISGLVPAQSVSETIIVAKPWYATWAFKIIIALVPAAIGYFIKWKRSRKTAAPLTVTTNRK